MNEPKNLFSNEQLSQVLRIELDKAINEINNLSADILLHTSIDSLIAQIFEKYNIEPIRLQENDISVEEQDVNKHKTSGSGETYRQMGTTFIYYVPFEGEENLFFYRPSTRFSFIPQAVIKNREIQFHFSYPLFGTANDPEKIGREVKLKFDNELKHLKQWLNFIAQDVEKYHIELKQKVKAQLGFRHQKLSKDKKIVSNLGFRLKTREGVPRTYKAPTKRQSLPTVRLDAQFISDPEPYLDVEHYEHILTVMRNMATVMEYSPSAFIEMGEEDLRWHFVVQLNGHYEGSATGETFNWTGKTDIIIKHKGKNIFIAECKYWKGKKSFIDTIDQLLGYKSWRDTKTAILLFSRNKDFSNVLKQIPDLVKKHANFKRMLSSTNETEFRFIFKHQGDDEREFHLTVMVFNVPIK